MKVITEEIVAVSKRFTVGTWRALRMLGMVPASPSRRLASPSVRVLTMMTKVGFLQGVRDRARLDGEGGPSWVPRISDILDGTRDSPQERFSESIGERTPHVMEEIREEIMDIPQDRISERNEERTVGVPVPHVAKEILEVIRSFPQQRISDRIVIDLWSTDLECPI